MDLLEWIDRSGCLLDALDDALSFIPEVPSSHPSDLPPECWTIVSSFLQMNTIAQISLASKWLNYYIWECLDHFTTHTDTSRALQRLLSSSRHKRHQDAGFRYMKHLTLVSQYGFLDHELLANVANSFRYLESIDLGGNDEADQDAFKPLSSLLHLRTLKLAGCESLTFEVFNGFASGLSSLTHIDISGVHFPVGLIQVEHNTNLQKLEAARISTRRSALQALFEREFSTLRLLTSLTYLDLRNSSGSHVEFAKVCESLTRLQTLLVPWLTKDWSNEESVDLWECLSSLRSLDYLDVSNCIINHSSSMDRLSLLLPLNTIRTLDLSNMRGSGSVNTFWKNLALLPQSITSLNLSNGHQLYTTNLLALNLPQLKFLDVTSTCCMQDELTMLANLPIDVTISCRGRPPKTDSDV